MDGREIPGFYFDREKGKYFRITAASREPGSDYKYTKENIRKQRKKEQAEKSDFHRAKRRKLETVVSSHAKDFLSHAYIHREIGFARRSYYHQRVWPGACVAGWEPETVVQPKEIRYFDRSPDGRHLYSVRGEHDIERRFLPPKADDPLAYNEDDGPPAFSPVAFDVLNRQRREDLARMTSPVSSMNYLPASGALVVTTIGSDRPPVVYLTDPERDGPYVGEQFTPRHCSTIWTSAPRPSFSASDPGTSIPAAETEHIAVGTSADLQLYTRPSSGSWDLSTPLTASSDIFALCWLDSTTLTLGHRDGTIKIYDTRTGGSAHALSHSTPVHHLRRADDPSRILCAGISNTLCVYDLRAGLPRGKQKRRSGGKKHGLPFPSSRSLYKFPSYNNSESRDLGLDVCHRLGLVAAADENEEVKLWNLYDGQVVRTFGEKLDCRPYWSARLSGANGKGMGAARCVRFLEDDDGQVRLWASFKGGVAKWGW